MREKNNSNNEATSSTHNGRFWLRASLLSFFLVLSSMWGIAHEPPLGYFLLTHLLYILGVIRATR